MPSSASEMHGSAHSSSHHAHKHHHKRKRDDHHDQHSRTSDHKPSKHSLPSPISTEGNIFLASPANNLGTAQAHSHRQAEESKEHASRRPSPYHVTKVPYSPDASSSKYHGRNSNTEDHLDRGQDVMDDVAGGADDTVPSFGHDAEYTPRPEDLTPGQKPAVGSEAWHKLRKNNHKEVERRRRETINDGINELAKLVSDTSDKNKGAILQRTVTYINQLRETEAKNIEKWNLEKCLTDQAIADLSDVNEALKEENARLRGQVELWKGRGGEKSDGAGDEVKKERGKEKEKEKEKSRHGYRS